MPDSHGAAPLVVWHDHAITRADRERLNGHRGSVLWFTGLSGCGKSTVANLVEQKLYQQGVRTCLLDGDNVRHGLNATPQILETHFGAEFAKRFGLGFGIQDRQENIRRVGAVAQMMCEAGLVALTAFVSPFRADRDAVRARFAPGDFCEIFVDAPLELCEARDPKGLYKKARAGQIQDFTGIDSPYEPPLAPELILDSARYPAAELADQIVQFMKQRGTLGPLA